MTKTLRWIPCLALLAMGAPRAQETETAPTSQPAWRALFDGKTLDGWSRTGGKATYHVDDASIVGTTKPNTPNTFLRTDAEFGDFELRLEFLVDPALNSGVQFRSQPHPKGTIFGYQCEIDPSKRAWSCGIYDERRRGWLAPLKDNEPARKAFRQGEWNAMRIECSGPHLRTWINNVLAADHLDSMTPKGVIALQVHGVGKRKDPLQVRWRNIRIREYGEHRWTPVPTGWDSSDDGPSLAIPEHASAIRWTYALEKPIRLVGPFGELTLPKTTEKRKTRKVSVSRTGNRYAVHVDGKLKLDNAGTSRTPIRLEVPKDSGPLELTDPEQLVRVPR